VWRKEARRKRRVLYIPTILIRQLHKANEERIAAEKKCVCTANQLYEYALGVQTEEEQREHQKVAEENEEDLLTYYSELWNDWQAAIKRGSFADKGFTASREELAT
jgi:hypothetical protein